MILFSSLRIVLFYNNNYKSLQCTLNKIVKSLVFLQEILNYKK